MRCTQCARMNMNKWNLHNALQFALRCPCTHTGAHLWAYIHAYLYAYIFLCVHTTYTRAPTSAYKLRSVRRCKYAPMYSCMYTRNNTRYVFMQAI